MKAILRSGFLALAIMAQAVPAHAGPFEDGKAAHERGDYQVALKIFTPLAEGGHVRAQYFLSYIYQLGHGVPQDDTKAAKWRRMAAEGGHAYAQYFMGKAQRAGILGVERNAEEAAQWHQKAAIQGIAEAQSALGDMYLSGDGVPQNYADGANWYRKAAELGDAGAQFRLGTLYIIGEGVPKDYVLAYMWLNLALASNSENAREQLYNVEERMTPDQIAEAQRMAREWMAKRPQ